MGRVAGKVALITGGARGQGAAHARRLSEEGAKVVISDIRDQEGHALAAALDAEYLTHDVGSDSSWRETMETVRARYGRLDVLVNNAGIAIMAGLAETDAALFERTVRVNQLGVFLGIKYGAELMKATRGGSIINISSITALKSEPRYIAYTSTKWAVRGLTRAAALELAPLGIRVNTIFPGIIDTPMLTDSVPGLDVAQFGAANTPLGRVGVPDDVASAIVFLASDESSFITGAELAVDGGVCA
ncbi:glucose 1-dehydrogenase [Phenylobacterium montanum]|uniref:D-xylose 1-dehydrogenase n=1 Tax=Phenylobacterium montanum TaxID=2823693 RepID=A0A975G4H2_9CAUL|nr:glucose 1-dehydrogenase [Caulobacter sp. S6]QUD90413.1 glucose 1-dehydrogenase [Caulobacter sp. S6]